MTAVSELSTRVHPNEDQHFLYIQTKSDQSASSWWTIPHTAELVVRPHPPGGFLNICRRRGTETLSWVQTSAHSLKATRMRQQPSWPQQMFVCLDLQQTIECECDNDVAVDSCRAMNFFLSVFSTLQSDLLFMFGWKSVIALFVCRVNVIMVRCVFLQHLLPFATINLLRLMFELSGLVWTSFKKTHQTIFAHHRPRSWPCVSNQIREWSRTIAWGR